MFFMGLGVFGFCVADACVKWLTIHHYNTWQILAVGRVPALMVAIMLTWRATGSPFRVKTSYFRIHALRSDGPVVRQHYPRWYRAPGSGAAGTPPSAPGAPGNGTPPQWPSCANAARQRCATSWRRWFRTTATWNVAVQVAVPGGA